MPTTCRTASARCTRSGCPARTSGLRDAWKQTSMPALATANAAMKAAGTTVNGQRIHPRKTNPSPANTRVVRSPSNSSSLMRGARTVK
jgi:hypothetical protein